MINILRLKKENETIKNKIVRDIINLFELENGEQDYYKIIRVGILWNNNYIEYESKGDKKKLPTEDILIKLDQYIINDLKKSDTMEIQLTIKTIKTLSMSSKNTDEDNKKLTRQKPKTEFLQKTRTLDLKIQKQISPAYHYNTNK